MSVAEVMFQNTADSNTLSVNVVLAQAQDNIFPILSQLETVCCCHGNHSFNRSFPKLYAVNPLPQQCYTLNLIKIC